MAIVTRTGPAQSGSAAIAQRGVETPGRPQILILSRDVDCGSSVAALLIAAGMGAHTQDPAHAPYAGQTPSELVVLDVGAPDEDGLRVLRLLHARGFQVVTLSTDSSEQSCVVPLEMGAVDHLTIPFDGRALVARVRARLRQRGPECLLDFAGLAIDLERRTVWRQDAPVHLSRKEFDVLAYLAIRPGVSHSRVELLRAVWGSEPHLQDPSTVNVHVRRLRAKLETDPRKPRWILTGIGGGYRFTP